MLAPKHLRGCELVLEAIPEDIELKQRVLGAVEHVAPHASICGAVDVGGPPTLLMRDEHYPSQAEM